MTWTASQRCWDWGLKFCLIALGALGIALIVKDGVGDADSLLHAMPSILLTVCAVASGLIGCFYGWLGLHHWRASRQVIRDFGGEERRVMSALCRISEAHQVVYGSKFLMLLVGLTGLTGAILLKEPRWLGITFLVVGLRWWLWVRVTTPPFILFLSCSDPASIEVHRQIKRLVSPLRVVTLLDLGNSPSAKTASELNLDCLRTWNSEDWKKVIFILIEMAPLIIMNAEAVTVGVHEEAIYITKQKLMFKTAFMKRHDTPLLRLQEEPAASAASCFVVSESNLRPLILKVLDSRELPVRNRAIGAWANGSGD